MTMRGKGPAGSGRGKAPAGSGGRSLKQRLKQGRRKAGSARWLQRHLSDAYVQRARASGYRSRAAFKLIRLDDRFTILRRGQRVLDLGAAPGGWSQVCAQRVERGRVVAVDLVEIEPISGVVQLQVDLLADDSVDRLEAALGGRADVVLSDLAAPTTGHRATDHLRTMALAEAATDVAFDVLRDGGSAVIKIFQGADEDQLYARLRGGFDRVQRVKPSASRQDSIELYMVARGFRGRGDPLE